MNVRIYQGHAPQMEPADVCVAIDVIRAFTTAHVAFSGGAEQIVLAGEVDAAFSLANESEDLLLAGERDAVKIEGFDLGNSPAEFSDADVERRGVILTTTNGVRAALYARSYGRTLACGYRGADAVIRWLRAVGAQTINLLASHPDGDEDVACAEYIRARLIGAEQPDASAVERRIRESRAARKFLDPDRLEFDPRDIEYCAARADDRFVMEVVEADEMARLETRCA
ncbi:MAG: 2-phosphosulfolactate phosphatase [Myxococcota bacterium]